MSGLLPGPRAGLRSGLNPRSSGGGATNTHSLQLVRASSQYADITDASQSGLDFAGTDKATFAAWVYCETLPGTGEVYDTFGKFETSVGGYTGPRILEDAGGYDMRGVVAGGGTNYAYEVDITAELVAQTWVHLAYTFDGTKSSSTRMEFFVDGVSKGNGVLVLNGAVQIDDGATDFFAAALNATTGHFNGRLDDLFVGSQVLTAAQIVTLKDEGPKAATPGIKDAWKWDGESYVSLINSNTLTPRNSPTFSTDTPY